MSNLINGQRIFSDRDRASIARLFMTARDNPITLNRLLRFDSSLANEYEITELAWQSLSQLTVFSYSELVEQYSDLLFADAISYLD